MTLLTHIRNTSPEETIQSLLDEAQSIRHIDYPRVIELGEQALAIADTLKHVAYQSRSLSTIAWGMVCQKQYDQSLQHAMQALTYARDHQLLYEEGMAANVLAVNYADNHNLSEALQYYLRQLELGGQLDNRDFQSYSLNDIGIIYLELEEYSTGIRYLEESVSFIDLINGQETMEHTLTYISLSKAHLNSDNLTLALDYADKALAICQREETQVWMSRVFALIGRIKTKQGAFDSARETLRQALQLAQEADCKDCLILSHHTWGDYFREQSNYVHALSHYTQALSFIVEPGPNKLLMLEILKKISDIHEKLGDYESALNNFKQCQEIERQINREQLQQQLQLAFVSYEASKQAESYRRKSEQLEIEMQIQKRTEVERMERERLQYSLKKERDLAQVKERILSRLGHEFRTPLSVIQTSAQILERYNDRLQEERKTHHYELIHREIAYIDNLLTNILSVLKSDTPATNDQILADDLHTTCQQAIITAYQTTGCKQHIHQIIDDDVESAEFHPTFVYNILVQLLCNALKFSHEAVYLRVSIRENNLILEVEDSGIGIPVDEQGVVFEPLYRGSNIDEISGTGLGLTIVNNYVSIYGGQVKLKSEINKGTIVSVSLPI